jgi:hypothetical protein
MGNKYQFRLKGHLDESWADWLSDMSIDHQHDGTTSIAGQVVDQIAQHGLLARIHDMGIPLLFSAVFMAEEAYLWAVWV